MNIIKIVFTSAILLLSSCGIFKGSKSGGSAANKNSENESTLKSLEENDLFGKSMDDFSGSEILLEEQGNITQNAEINPLKNSGLYVVEKNDTLMLIAFKIYGDYRKWKELAKANPGALKTSKLKIGRQLKYNPPLKPFSWKAKGNPYLIKNGDTLGIISKNVYQTPKKWKSIWENNRPMIPNPNLIFAGFTLYYLDEASLAVGR